MPCLATIYGAYFRIYRYALGVYARKSSQFLDREIDPA